MWRDARAWASDVASTASSIHTSSGMYSGTRSTKALLINSTIVETSRSTEPPRCPISRRSLIYASATLLVLSIMLTWPQAQFLQTKVAAHNDPFLSMWRLGWIAHALRTDPHHLFDANIFYPEQMTLAYSDATLLEGALAAPLLWAKFSPVGVYNVLLLAGIVSSGIGMFVLALHLTRNENAALVSAAVFTLAPYRIEHYMHLELQWTVWIPLALWAVHRAIEDQSFRFGILAGIFLWLQILSCVYYGIFLAIMLAVVAVPLLLTDPRHRRPGRGLAGLVAGAVLLVPLSWHYAQPYLAVSRIVGPRTLADIATYSAQPINYLASPTQNWFWG